MLGSGYWLVCEAVWGSEDFQLTGVCLDGEGLRMACVRVCEVKRLQLTVVCGGQWILNRL